MTDGKVRILAIGDVVGKSGCGYLKEKLWSVRKYYGADMAIVNGENAAPGNGLDRETADLLFRSGADVITSGNHIFHRSAVGTLLEEEPNVLRPANYPAACPGSGWCVFAMHPYRVLVINLLGTVFMESLDSPFEVADRILAREKGNFDLSFVDIHAEATSEKQTLARYLDGRVTGVFGTHTHVQTADEQVLSGGTGYITDLGMTGPEDSVLGIRADVILRRFLTKMPVRHEEAETPPFLCGALFTADLKTGLCAAVERVCVRG